MPPSVLNKKAGLGPPSLPSSFTKLRDIIEERVSPGATINAIGTVTDCRLPIPTSGTGKLLVHDAQFFLTFSPDYKSTLTLHDLSTQDGSEGILLNIFYPEAEMPQVGAGDIVFLSRVKVCAAARPLTCAFLNDAAGAKV
jgi:protection of telomeres protein 1